MKEKKAAVVLAVIVALVIVAIIAVSIYQKDRDRRDLAKRINSLGNPMSEARLRGTPPETVEGLKAAIARYEKQIDRYLSDVDKTGTYWKILAIRLHDRGFHGEALEALERAIYYTPSDPVLHFYTGVSAGIAAKSFHNFPGSGNSQREFYFTLAEEAFLRAIELDSYYVRPRYSLGVLYAFDLDKPLEAIPHLEICLSLSRNDVDAMFVLARAYFMVRQFQNAINLYDRIIGLTKDENQRTEAQYNRQTVLEQMHG